MRLTFIETSGFTEALPDYFPSDEAYAKFQGALLTAPEQGDVMPGCGGLRKVRWRDSRRGKGRRGGLRIIYLHLPEDATVFLLDIYDKDEADDLSPDERKALTALAQHFRDEAHKKRTRKPG